MRLQAAMKAMSDESTVLDVITDCQVYFDKVEEIGGLFANGVVDTPIECRKVLADATAIYLALNPILALAETEKANREVIFFTKLKMDTENAGGKFVATNGDREASVHVASYRKVRNILEGYVESVKVIISTCQSSLKSMGDENRILNSATTS